jgi:GR25 family glycosyltransferase involved in LPS biosynthesis
MHVNDRAKDHMDHNRNILANFEYLDDVEYFDGNSGDGLDVLNQKKIKTDVWNPYDGRQFLPLPGEYGIWVSTLSVWDYIIDNDLDSLLVLEDDITLNKNAEKIIKLLVTELPANWDFLSMYSFEDQNAFDKNTNINSKYIHKSTNQPAAAQAILYSNSGAKKLKNLLYEKGIEYTNDCFIHRQSIIGAVNGYSVIPGAADILVHENNKIESIIDPKSLRLEKA